MFDDNVLEDTVVGISKEFDDTEEIFPFAETDRFTGERLVKTRDNEEIDAESEENTVPKLDGSGTMEARKLEEDEEEDDDGDITLETESVVW